MTNAYQTQGYILGRAVLPPQEITDGIITVEVYEGILDSDESGIRINGTDLRIREERVRGILSSAVKQGQALEEKALERGVLLISDLPGIHASANLEKGNSPGLHALYWMSLKARFYGRRSRLITPVVA